MPRQQQVSVLPLAIKAWRGVRELSQFELAKKAGCSEGLIAQIETGRRQPGLANAIAIAGALGVELGVIAHVYANEATVAALSGAVDSQPEAS